MMCINTHVDSRTIIKMLELDGWHKVDQSGSHIQFRIPKKIYQWAHLKVLKTNQELYSDVAKAEDAADPRRQG
jgi:predicted RNA binding protein YcfA (HicA-like mRNA interferase family)